jgi:hypothetical protein
VLIAAAITWDTSPNRASAAGASSSSAALTISPPAIGGRVNSSADVARP